MSTRNNKKSTLLSLVESEKRYQIIISSVVIVATFAIPALRPSIPKLAVTGLQILGAIAGAYLGSLFQRDRTRVVIASHVRLSVRHLLDILSNLRSLTILAGDFRARLQEEGSANDKRLIVARTEEWLERIEDDARKLIGSVASSTESWKDLSEEAYQTEVQEYARRDARLGTNGEKEEPSGEH
ncbi:hypothetical protein [Micromonospora nigra]|uniref:hypothetical protein n=1 Tax=Micromonospora nigra TaxID=145857 RepID=UPI001112E640|nr:hypothetical protein [Micromonospora nigra]